MYTNLNQKVIKKLDSAGFKITDTGKNGEIAFVFNGEALSHGKSPSLMRELPIGAEIALVTTSDSDNAPVLFYAQDDGISVFGRLVAEWSVYREDGCMVYVRSPIIINTSRFLAMGSDEIKAQFLPLLGVTWEDFRKITSGKSRSGWKKGMFPAKSGDKARQEMDKQGIYIRSVMNRKGSTEIIFTTNGENDALVKFIRFSCQELQDNKKDPVVSCKTGILSIDPDENGWDSIVEQPDITIFPGQFPLIADICYKLHITNENREYLKMVSLKNIVYKLFGPHPVQKGNKLLNITQYAVIHDGKKPKIIMTGEKFPKYKQSILGSFAQHRDANKFEKHKYDTCKQVSVRSETSVDIYV